MQTVSGFPYFEVEFTKDGAVSDPAQVAALHDCVVQSGPSDLLVISHGWNNDMADARDLYARFLACVRAVLDQGAIPAVAARSFAVMAVLWPSKKFADEELIPSGAAALGSAVSIAFVQQQLDRLEQALQSPDKSPTLVRARALVPALENSPAAQQEFADLIRSVLPATAAEVDDASTDFFARSGKDLMDRLAKPTMVGGGAPVAGGAAAIPAGWPAAAAGGAAGLGETFSGILSAARNLLNYSTYYLMKERAGTVGSRGVNGVLRQLKAAQPSLRVHLAGHSFGGRLVTSVADGPSGQSPLAFDTLTLLQAAFSHNGFAAKFDGTRDGGFRAVVTEHKIRGPILITHSTHDRAVGVAYPLASRVAGQDAAALGDENDRFGGMGRNGAQHTPERVVGALQPVSTPYAFAPGKVFNLNADSLINEHSDICHNEVAFALLTAVAAS
jgi:ribosomal protein L12E/L44/L45/RPP1/RPP2